MSGGNYVDPLAPIARLSMTGTSYAYGLTETDEVFWETGGRHLDAPLYIPGGSAVGSDRQGNYPASPRVTLRGGFFS